MASFKLDRMHEWQDNLGFTAYLNDPLNGWNRKRCCGSVRTLFAIISGVNTDWLIWTVSCHWSRKSNKNPFSARTSHFSACHADLRMATMDDTVGCMTGCRIHMQIIAVYQKDNGNRLSKYVQFSV